MDTASSRVVADGRNHERVSRRQLLVSGGLAAATASASWASAGAGPSRTDTAPRTLDGQPVPEPAPDQSAEPIKAARGSTLTGKTAVVTGAEYKVTGGDSAKDI